MRSRTFPVLILAILLLAVRMTAAQPGLVEQSEFTELERKVDRLADNREEAAGGCGLAILFGAFCALWAQNTGRNPWSWFFLGALFNVITVLLLLLMNSQDLQARQPVPPAAPPGPQEPRT